MNEKEIGELRRHLRADRCAVGALYGCFVNEKQEIVSTFRQSLATTPKDDADAALALMRKALSGAPGKNLLTLPFTTEQVMDSDEHRMFCALRNRDEAGEAGVEALFRAMSAALVMDTPYLILLAQDAYDVPAFGKDGEAAEDGAEVFSYCLCAVCPVKETKPALGFFPVENTFRSLTANRVVSPPELGFLFPSFDDRSANIYDLLYYSRHADAIHPEFMEQVANVAVPMPADEQKDAFQEVLAEALSEDCSMKVAVELRDAICEQIAEAKERKDEDPPTVTRGGVSRMLRDCGVGEERISAFEEGYTARFGDAALPPRNLVDEKRIEVRTPDVEIRVNTDRSDLIRTQTIDGVRYILIRAENGVEVSGMKVEI